MTDAAKPTTPASSDGVTIPESDNADQATLLGLDLLSGLGTRWDAESLELIARLRALVDGGHGATLASGLSLDALSAD